MKEESSNKRAAKKIIFCVLMTLVFYYVAYLLFGYGHWFLGGFIALFASMILHSCYRGDLFDYEARKRLIESMLRQEPPIPNFFQRGMLEEIVKRNNH